MSISPELKPILDILTSDKNLKLIAIYGSFASGKERADSDVDIAVAGDHPLERESLQPLTEKITSLTDRYVDLVDLRRIAPPLTQEIFHDAVWIKKDPQTYYQVLKKSLFDAEDFLPVRNQILEKRIRRFVK